MNFQKPVVSVLMPVYNGAEYLKYSIESILSQTFKNFEFLIIDDCSSDSSIEIIKSYKDDRIKLIQNEKNLGQSKTMNKGIDIAQGKYIARFDQDDISHNDRLDYQVDFLDKNNNVIIVGSNAKIIDKDGNHIYTTSLECENLNIKAKLPYISPFIHPSIMLRKSSLRIAGCYLDIPIIQDLLLFIRMSELGEFSNIETPLINYRLSPSAATRRDINTNKRLEEALKYFIVNRKITQKHKINIESSIKKSDPMNKLYNYYILISKKYLFINHKPKLVRENILKSMTYKKVALGGFTSAFPFALNNHIESDKLDSE
jgi:glycosyltransferase involved in cell wall biosynthesis